MMSDPKAIIKSFLEDLLDDLGYSPEYYTYFEGCADKLLKDLEGWIRDSKKQDKWRVL